MIAFDNIGQLKFKFISSRSQLGEVVVAYNLKPYIGTTFLVLIKSLPVTLPMPSMDNSFCTGKMFVPAYLGIHLTSRYILCKAIVQTNGQFTYLEVRVSGG